EAIAVDLFETRAIEPGGTELVFDDEDQPAIRHHEIGTPAHARDEELEKEVRLGQSAGEIAQVPDLKFPRCALGWFHLERQLARELPIELIVARTPDVRRQNREVGAVHLRWLQLPGELGEA